MCIVHVSIGVFVWRSRWRIGGRLAVDQMSVVAYQGVLAKGRFLGTSISEFVPVVVARMIYSAIRLDVSVEAHGPIVAGEASPDGRRSGVL